VLHSAETLVAETLLHELRARLEGAGLRPVRVVLTKNRARLVSVHRPSGRGTEVRVSRHVLGLGERVLEAIVDFVAGRPGATTRLRAHFADLGPLGTARPIRLRPRGDHHDLGSLAETESLSSFGTPSPVSITWGQRRKLRHRQSGLRFGAYFPGQLLISIHPLLDQPVVPSWFLRFVIYHELLHHHLGTPHTRVFRARERQHPDYARALELERSLVTELLRMGYSSSLASAAPRR
jgi:hypothetical protein